MTLTATFAPLVANTVLADATTHSGGLAIICTILLVAGLIALLFGLADLVGLTGRLSSRVGGGHALLVGVALLIIWFVVC